MNNTYGNTRITPSTVVSDTVYQTLRGAFFGAVWGMMTPFHAPGTVAAKEEAVTGIFKPARTFSCIKSIGHNSAIVATIMGVQRFTSKSVELVRQKEDYFNDIIGFAVTYKYYSHFLGSSEQRLIRHNRFLGSFAMVAVIYGVIV